MNALLKIEDLAVYDGEPTVQDLRLGELLGFELQHDVRKLIRRNIDELQRYGEVFATVAKTSARGGRPGKTYFLNEAQALLVAIKSDAPNAAEVREQVIRVFMAWRRGDLQAPAVIQDAAGDKQRLALALVTEARLIFGKGHAAAIWQKLGLPMPEAALPDPEPRACLLHLLDTLTAEGTVRDTLSRLFAAKESTRNRLRLYGLGEEGDGFTVDHIHPFIAKAFAETRWPRAFEYLRKLPGARPAARLYRRKAGDATYLPSHYIDLR